MRVGCIDIGGTAIKSGVLENGALTDLASALHQGRRGRPRRAGAGRTDCGGHAGHRGAGRLHLRRGGHRRGAQSAWPTTFPATPACPCGRSCSSSPACRSPWKTTPTPPPWARPGSARAAVWSICVRELRHRRGRRADPFGRALPGQPVFCRRGGRPCDPPLRRFGPGRWAPAPTSGMPAPPR